MPMTVPKASKSSRFEVIFPNVLPGAVHSIAPDPIEAVSNLSSAASANEDRGFCGDIWGAACGMPVRHVSI